MCDATLMRWLESLAALRPASLSSADATIVRRLESFAVSRPDSLGPAEATIVRRLEKRDASRPAARMAEVAAANCTRALALSCDRDRLAATLTVCEAARFFVAAGEATATLLVLAVFAAVFVLPEGLGAALASLLSLAAIFAE